MLWLKKNSYQEFDNEKNCNFLSAILDGRRKKIYPQHCIFSRGYLPFKMASKTVITDRRIRFRAVLPIRAPFRLAPPPFECVFVNIRVRVPGAPKVNFRKISVPKTI